MTERIAAVQARAEQVLADCSRVLVPIMDAPVSERAGTCVCGGLPDVRVSMRLDGVEMFWTNACPLHHDEPVTISIS
jgi:hypothetical protein